jgi:hypothetical protein
MKIIDKKDLLYDSGSMALVRIQNGERYKKH